MNEPVIQKIQEWKARRDAVILVHNYQLDEIQDIADILGDSLELSRKASEVSAEVIVFCGVHFMAETAAVLNPGRTVLMPVKEAGCPMADMITAPQLREMKADHPDAAVVCYVNSTAGVKAESDCCCTSANAADVIRSFDPDRPIIFVPDKYLGMYAAKQTGRELILWNGYCPTHVRIQAEDIARLKQRHPDAVAMVHPECTPEVQEAADDVLSTGGMVRVARESQARMFIVGTETGMLHRLRRENPTKEFYAVTDACVCPNMKRNRLENVLWCLEDMEPRITVPEDVREPARKAIENMLAVTRKTPETGRGSPS